MHIRKKRLLDSLDEDPALNNCGLHQQDATDDPAFVLVSFDENQFKKGNENIKVLDLHANHEMHMNSCGENYISHEQQSNVATTEENKMPDLNETFCVKEHENKPNKGMQLCQEYRHLDEISHEVLDPLVLDEETLLQLYLDGQMPLTNLWKSQINTINDKNKTKNANNFVAFDNEQETNNNMASYLNESFQMNSCNAGNVSCQEQQADNAMQSPNYLESKIIAFTEANDVNIEGMKLLLNMLDNDKESIASFENPSPINDNEEAFSNENFEMLSGNDNDNESALEVRGEIDKNKLEKLKREVEQLEEIKRIKEENLFNMLEATVQLLRFGKELEQQEDFEDEQNMDVDKSEDKDDFEMNYTNDNKYDIPQAHTQNEYPRQSPEYQEQHKMVALHNDFSELQYNEKKNLPQCPISSEEQINIMKNQFETPQIQLEIPQTDDIRISSTTSDEYPTQMQIESRFEADEYGMVCIGPNGTMIPITTLESINWSLKGTAITRKLLVEIFGNETLAVHNLSGKPSPAFIEFNRPVKGQLDPNITADLIQFMGEQKGLTPKEVKHTITTKCADVNKMLRRIEKKRQRIAEQNMIS